MSCEHVSFVVGYVACLTVNQLKEIVEDKVLATLTRKLERLGVVHGALLLVNL